MRIGPVLFAFTDQDGWHPGIGDPTFVGWLTVFAYLLASVLCLRAAFSANGMRSRRQVLFWLLLAPLLFALGINKQLDLQTWLTLVCRKMAIYEGLYERRRLIQFIFIVGVAGLGAWGFGRMWKLVKGESREVKVALAGLLFLIVFVVIRAASFHHIDQFLKYDIGGFRMNWLLELGGISMIGWGAYKTKKRGAVGIRRRQPSYAGS